MWVSVEWRLVGSNVPDPPVVLRVRYRDLGTVRLCVYIFYKDPHYCFARGSGMLHAN